ncbi:MAG: PQQ-binding-like beta-propeller repeat protein [Candidatus Omnitrophota bacterium]
MSDVKIEKWVLCCFLFLVVGAQSGIICNAGGEKQQEYQTSPPDSFILPDKCCPMVHADLQMSDNVKTPALIGNVGLIWHDDLKYGSLMGAGASSNGNIAACTFRNYANGYSSREKGDNLIVYDYDGNRLWTSGDKLNHYAWASAPLVSTQDEVIACDNQNIYRFDRNGKVIWQSELPESGVPISPVMTESGIIVLATEGGPVYVYDSRNGTLCASKYLWPDSSTQAYYETINTPCGRGDRIYISTQNSNSNSLGRLAAIDVDAHNPDEANRLNIAWFYDFEGPSGASPLLIKDELEENIIYFDGAKSIFALRDRGTYCEEVWKADLSSSITASFAQDPRGGFWYFPTTSQWLVRRAEENGEILQQLNLSQLLCGNSYSCGNSIMSIYGDPDYPIMITGASTVLPPKTYIIAVDLVNETLLWKYLIGKSVSKMTYGQFPALIKNGRPRVVFTTNKDGTYCIGVPK